MIMGIVVIINYSSSYSYSDDDWVDADSGTATSCPTALREKSSFAPEKACPMGSCPMGPFLALAVHQ